MGKWSSLKAQYPALPADPSHAEAIAAATEAWASKPIGEIAAAYNEAREVKENMHATLSEQEVTVEALKRVLVDLGMALAATGKPEEAVKHYHEVQRINPENKDIQAAIDSLGLGKKKGPG